MVCGIKRTQARWEVNPSGLRFSFEINLFTKGQIFSRKVLTEKLCYNFHTAALPEKSKEWLKHSGTTILAPKTAKKP